MRFVAAIAAALVLWPAAPVLAGHGDPTHGVVPHSVSDQPFDIHPVNIATAHPYGDGESYSWDISVPDADSLSIHFERYDTNGFYFGGQCFGSAVRIVDANTGLELEMICGNQFVQAGEYFYTNDVWTPDYQTNAITLTFDTQVDFFGGDHYGFDVYEVASNGARAIASVPYSSEATTIINPTVFYALDPFAPESSTAEVGLYAVTEYGGTRVQRDTRAQYGEIFVCGPFICSQAEGVRASDGTEVAAAGHSFVLEGSLVAYRDDESSTGFSDPEASVRCEVDGNTCG